MKSNILTANFTLLVCNLPIMCNFNSGFFSFISNHLSKASWTLFSPKFKCPCSIKGKILSILNVLDTAMIFGKFILFKSLKLDLSSFSILIKFCTILCIIFFKQNITL